MDRRNFLKSGTLAAAGATLLPRLRADEVIQSKQPEARADACILLWLPGGLAQTQTFDMKEYTPFETGMEARRCKSTYKAIPTSADGVQISEGLPLLAKQMHHGAICRSVTSQANFGAIHLRAQYYAMTGYLFPAGVEAPSIGSWISRAKGPRKADVPAYIDIGRDITTSNEEFLFIANYQGPGFLGVNHAPFMVPDPERGIPTLKAIGGMADARVERRQQYLRAITGVQDAALAETHKVKDYLHVFDQARSMMGSSAGKAFDLSLEKKESYDAYNTGRFGLGCLLARRLVESGARFIEVEYQYSPFGTFDTHENGHTRMGKLMNEIDRPISQLITDLHERGLLKRTLVVIMTEFGRMIAHAPSAGSEPIGFEEKNTGEGMKFEKESQYGMHGHMSKCRSMVFFGGGIKGGSVYGKTADEHPMVIVEKPAKLEDVHATIYEIMGISPDYHQVTEERPFFVTKDGTGKAIPELLA